MRLFYAVELPSDVRAALGALRPHDAGDYRWVDPELMHVTLAFLGEQPPERLADVESAGASAAATTPSAHLVLAAIGRFGPASSPRVVLASLGGDLDALAGLQAKLATALAERGFPLEDRPFRPHITLARRRANALPRHSPALPASVPGLGIPMDHLTLFQSRLSQRGPTYTALARYPLGV